MPNINWTKLEIKHLKTLVMVNSNFEPRMSKAFGKQEKIFMKFDLKDNSVEFVEIDSMLNREQTEYFINFVSELIGGNDDEN